MTTIDQNRRAVVALLRLGVATQSEAADLAGVSRQRVAYWAFAENLDCVKIRARVLADAWRRATQPDKGE